MCKFAGHVSCLQGKDTIAMFHQVSILRHHIYEAANFGADFHELCKRMKITPEQLNNGEGQLPWDPADDTDFWTHAIALTNNPVLGLHMGHQSVHNGLGMVGMLAERCKTVQQALEMLCLYNETFTNLFAISLDLTGAEAVFYFNPHAIWEKANLESARQAVDMWISSLLRSTYRITGKHIYPVRTELRYAKRHVEEYVKILRNPIFFNKPSNCMIFQKKDLKTPIISYDESLLPVFIALLQKKQEQLATRSLKGQIKSLLLAAFQGQIVHIDIVASRLHMTTRTLQRKLSEEKTSYREISAELRKELAEGLLKVGKVRKAEVASLLGYSDSSSFSKALKSWDMK
jgi:AraC-like DNA-binding protein